MRWMNGIPDSMDMSSSKIQEIIKDSKPGILQPMGSQRVRHNLVTEQQPRKSHYWQYSILSLLKSASGFMAIKTYVIGFRKSF